MKLFLGLLSSVVLCSTPLISAVRYFPQIGDGSGAGFQLQTTLVFVNPGAASTISLAFRTDAGDPMEVDLGGSLGSGADFQIPLAAGGSTSVTTAGEGALRTGYASFDASDSVGGTAIFSGKDVASGVALFEAGVPASAPTSSFTLFTDSIGDLNTGLAVVRPNSGASSGDDPVDLALTLVDPDGQALASATLSLKPGEKVAKFFNQLFEGVEVEGDPQEMRGSLQVASPNAGVAAVSLRQLQVTAAFPVQVPVLTTLPIVPGAASAESGWTQVWADEFDGPEIDRNHWTFEFGNGINGWGNNERQYYTDRTENARIEDGKLVIEARLESFGGRPYTSARMKSANKADFKYGRFEIRARLPEGRGIWPAIWMMPTDSVYGGWAASGEIDIMELIGQEPSTVHGTLHYGGAWPSNVYSGTPYTLASGKFIDDFHVFALEWEEGVMRWYVDGVLFSTQDQWYTQGHPFPAPFDQEFYFILNVAVGGNWPGFVIDESKLPQRMEIDYIRVYQRPQE